MNENSLKLCTFFITSFDFSPYDKKNERNDIFNIMTLVIKNSKDKNDCVCGTLIY